MKPQAARKRKKPSRAKRIAHLARGAKRALPLHPDKSSPQKALAWIWELAAPYLKGYAPQIAQEHELQGYWFLAEGRAQSEEASRKSLRHTPIRGHAVGFFVGYLNEAAKAYSFLRPEPPECLVFAWIGPPDSLLHGKLVRQPDSLVRKTFEYIRWLTHRPPRFVFHEAEAAAMTRHASMAAWPQEKRQHLSRNFFIETLAWLVRSGLVRKLREEAMLISDEQKS